MKITAIRLHNVRSFKYLTKTELSKKINIFIGANNAGKSTILNSIFLLQRTNALVQADIRIGENNGQIELFFEGEHPPAVVSNPSHECIVFELFNGNRFYGGPGGGTGAVGKITETEPQNLMYPFLSKRKVVAFADTMNEQNANTVSGNFTNLYSKIDRLVTPQFQPANTDYVEACKNILGYEIATLAKAQGKQAVYFVHNLEHISLSAMGEGIVNILGLVTDLCMAENKIFLIEEPENDIHPKALKELLKLIIAKSSTNQFFVSTHSNIVMKYLGSAENSKVFNVTTSFSDDKRNKLFTSSIQEVSDNPEERRKVLEELGYDFFDFDLWNGWLFLEESSAEVLIREYFIKWYVPSLKHKLRTFSSGSSGNVFKKFEDFNTLFVFLHLQPTYKNKVWVIIDGGTEEHTIIKKMKEVYSKSGWKEENFSQFSEHDFEKYYPTIFQDEAENVLTMSKKTKEEIKIRRVAKEKLLKKVMEWATANEDIAKKDFELSAGEVIGKLKEMGKQLVS